MECFNTVPKICESLNIPSWTDAIVIHTILTQFPRSFLRTNDHNVSLEPLVPLTSISQAVNFQHEVFIFPCLETNIQSDQKLHQWLGRDPLSRACDENYWQLWSYFWNFSKFNKLYSHHNRFKKYPNNSRKCGQSHIQIFKSAQQSQHAPQKKFWQPKILKTQERTQLGRLKSKNRQQIHWRTRSSFSFCRKLKEEGNFCVTNTNAQKGL